MTSNGLVPLIRYRDVAAAVDWLSTAFGFEKRNIVTDPDGSIAYAELSYGRGIVMLGPVGQSNLDRLLKQPDEVGGAGTQSVYVAVDDVESHFKHARSAGADIVLEFGSEEAGDRAYAARDPEGHVWNFGAYSPWPAVAVPKLAAAAEPAFAGRPSRAQSILGGAVAALAVASVAGLATLDAQKPVPRFIAAPAAPASTGNDAETIALKETLAREAHARQEAARTAAAIREELAREREQRLAAETARNTLRDQLAQKNQLTEKNQLTQKNQLSEKPQPSPAAVAATPPQDLPPPTAPEAPAATAAAPTATTPVTTGSLGGQPKDAALAPTAAEPAPPVTVGPATPVQSPATATVAPAKPKPVRRSQAQKKKPPPKKTGGNDPLFMYD
jgi:uncharacterized glyoxalase superfamily protein PhnB